MPELPEVETIVRDLRSQLIHQSINSMWRSDQKLRFNWQPSWSTLILNKPITSLSRRGKWIVLAFHDESALLIHLGMTGQLTVHSIGDTQLAHTHLIAKLGNTTELRYRDIRRFGGMIFFPHLRGLHEYLDARIGPEPFEVDPDYFRNALMNSQSSIKAILLDQSILAGVGNIYVDESCFHAGLHPGRRGNSLSRTEVDRLRIAIERVLEQAIAGRGSTIRNYVGGSGLKGSYQSMLAVYRQVKRPCQKCGTTIATCRLAGRITYYCSHCQPQ